LLPAISNQAVTITVPGLARSWQVDFYDTTTGTDITSSVTVTRKGGQIKVALPDFKDEVAFKMYLKQ
jgi:hypothetical protein